MKASRLLGTLALVWIGVTAVTVPAFPADLLVTSTGADQVLRYDGSTGAFNSVFASAGGLGDPAGLVFGPDGHLYVSSLVSDAVLRYHGSTGAFIDVFASGGGLDGPHGLVFGPDGHLYVASFNSHQVLRYHGSTGAFIDVFGSVPGVLVSPTGLVFGPDGHLYVSSFSTNHVLRFDGTTGAPLGVFASVLSPVGVVFGSGGHLYVSSTVGNNVLRFDGNTGGFIDIFASGGGLASPHGALFGPDGHLYVASFDTDEILRYDGITGAFIDVFASGGGLDVPVYLVFMPPPCSFTVDAGGGGTHATIQAAVNALPDPGPCEIVVKNGTYKESVRISARNSAAATATQTIVIRAETPGLAIVNPGTLPGSARHHAFHVEGSRFITIQGFKVTGATREAIYVKGGLLGNRDIAVKSNEITGNGSVSTNGGIFIGRENAGTVVDSNKIHRNTRNGLEIEADMAGNPINSSKLISNNRICLNGWNGIHAGRTVKDVITLQDNDVHCNGTATGSTGGRVGVFRAVVSPKAGPGFRQNIVLNGNDLCSNRLADIASINQTLGPPGNDSGNVTTFGTEQGACASPGCTGAIAGTCAITACTALCPP